MGRFRGLGVLGLFIGSRVDFEAAELWPRVLVSLHSAMATLKTLKLPELLLRVAYLSFRDLGSWRSGVASLERPQALEPSMQTLTPKAPKPPLNFDPIPSSTKDIQKAPFKPQETIVHTRTKTPGNPSTLRINNFCFQQLFPLQTQKGGHPLVTIFPHAPDPESPIPLRNIA